MLHKLLRTRAAPPPPAAVPDGQRVYAIGDIHGRLDLLERLLSAIDIDDDRGEQLQTTFVFLGDLVDRGPDSAGVVERIIKLSAQRNDVRTILGNHEELLLGALDGDAPAIRLFCRVGGRETALSYGIGEREYDAMNYAELAAALGGMMPDTHRVFLKACTDMEVIGGYAFVHAGVRPDRALDDQRGSDLRWIRDPFLDHRGLLAKTIVHGHTITDAVDIRPHRIGIDTGAYATGRLSALCLEGERVRWLDTA